MIVRGISWFSLAVVVCALAAAPSPAYVLESSDSTPWWEETAANKPTGGQGAPITLTWSIAPDGTRITGLPSNLISFLAAHWGAHPTETAFDQQPWFFLFEQSFARLSALSGVTFQYEPNDDGVFPTPASGRSFSNALAAAGVLGVRGDIRIGGKSFLPDTTTLAATYFPDYGEMMINTDQTGYLYNAYENYRYFRNTIMHEALHAIGIHHVYSSTANFLAEPTITTGFEGPQLDDILAMHRLYGDALEKSGGNNSHVTATSLGALAPNGLLARGTLGASTIVDVSETDFLSIDGVGDVDYFSFSLAEQLTVTLSATPQGATYMMGASAGSQASYNAKTLSDLALALFDASGTTQIGATANAAGAGGAEAIVELLQPGTYYARITGAQDDVQLYQLMVSAGPTLAGADFNGDTFVDQQDLETWQAHYGRDGDATLLQGDANGDMAVNGADLMFWQRTVQLPPATTPHVGGTPEPTGWAIAIGALVAGLSVRRKR